MLAAAVYGAESLGKHTEQSKQQRHQGDNRSDDRIKELPASQGKPHD